MSNLWPPPESNWNHNGFASNSRDIQLISKIVNSCILVIGIKVRILIGIPLGTITNLNEVESSYFQVNNFENGRYY